MQTRQRNYNKKYGPESKHKSYPLQSVSCESLWSKPCQENLSLTSDRPTHNKSKVSKKTSNISAMARSFSLSVLDLIREQQSKEAVEIKVKSKVNRTSKARHKVDIEYEDLLNSLNAIDKAYDESDNIKKVSSSSKQRKLPKLSRYTTASQRRQSYERGKFKTHGFPSEVTTSELPARCDSESSQSPISWAFIPPLATEGTEYNAIAHQSMRLSGSRHMHSPFKE